MIHFFAFLIGFLLLQILSWLLGSEISFISAMANSKLKICFFYRNTYCLIHLLLQWTQCYMSPVGLLFGNSTEIGFYCKLTNAYCLVGTGGSNNFYRFSIFSCTNEIYFLLEFCIWFQMDWNSVPVLQMNRYMCFWYSAIEAELEDAIPIIKTSVGGGCSGVGRFCIGKLLYLN